MVRLGILLLRHPIGRLVAGALLILSGLIYGFTSHDVKFQQLVDKNTQISVEYIALEDNTYLVHPKGESTYYSIDPAKFTPRPNDGTFQKEGAIMTSLVYESDSQSANYRDKDGAAITGTQYAVEQFTMSDAQSNQVYKTGDYDHDSTKLYDNRWPVGGLLILLGALIVGLSLFLRRRKAQPVAGAPYAGPVAGHSGPYVGPIVGPTGPGMQPQAYTPAPPPPVYPTQNPPGQWGQTVQAAPPQSAPYGQPPTVYAPNPYPQSQPGQFRGAQPGNGPYNQPGQFPDAPQPRPQNNR